MNKYFKIILDHDKVNEIFGDLTPFNLKKEIKQLSNEEKNLLLSIQQMNYVFLKNHHLGVYLLEITIYI